MPISLENTINEDILYTKKECNKYYVDGLKKAEDIIRRQEIYSKDSGALFLSLIENEILNIKIEEMTVQIELLQEKIIRYEKG